MKSGTANSKTDPEAPQESNKCKSVWSFWHIVLALLLVSASVWLTGDAWSKIVEAAVHDEESSQISLVLIAFPWLVLSRRSRLQNSRPVGNWLGPALIAIGWASHVYGYDIHDNEFWLFGAILMAVGGIVTAVGRQVFWRLWPAFLVLGFLIPVPGFVRMHVSVPLQTVMAYLTEQSAQILGLPMDRNGNLLIVGGQAIEVAEACNGMRMVFALFLATYTFVFVNTLRPVLRVVLLAGAPAFALFCNLIRMLPTVWLYGNSTPETAQFFHDAAGWAMVPLAFVLLMAMIALLEWVGVDPMSARAESSQQSRPTSPRSQPLGRSVGQLGSACLSIVLLIGLAVSLQSRRPSGLALAYLERIDANAKRFPVQIGEWEGRDVRVHDAAVDILRPLVLHAREYRNQRTGQAVTLQLIYCKDAWNMVWHFPPVCFKHNGWTATFTQPRRWQVRGRRIDLVEYGFQRDVFSGGDRIVVANFMLLPTGLGVDMDDVRAVARDPSKRTFGVGQVQLIYNESMPLAQRQDVFVQFLAAHWDFLAASSGGQLEIDTVVESGREDGSSTPPRGAEMGLPSPDKPRRH